MDAIDVKTLRKALVGAGLEVFRVRGDEVHLAERQNVQLMEAGVRVRGGTEPAVTVTARSQRADAPTLSEDAMLAMVRDRNRGLVDAGYAEVGSRRDEIRSVSDPNLVLDVWFLVEYRRDVASLDEAVAEAQRAMAAERYVAPA